MTTEQITFNKIANGNSITELGKHKVFICGKDIHYRFKTNPKTNPNRFPFNINPNSLTSQLELFICGNENTYYLVPTEMLKEMYNHPNAYRDKLHPDITIITINISNDTVTYGRPSLNKHLSAYKNITL